MTLRVALVDDHQPFRERLRALLTRDPDLTIVAEASSGDQLLEIALTTGMDAVCMDISLPGMSGIEATRRLLAIQPGVRVIGLSAYAEPHYVQAMLKAGAAGHFTKGEAGEPLLQAIRTATPERPVFGADISFPLAADRTAATAPHATPPRVEAPALSDRELEILRLIADGCEPGPIAHALSMDLTMVDVYRRNIMRKLHLQDDAALDDYARIWALRNDGGKKPI
jgi:DNA-binding NarL/FixJ family response regulator